MQSDPRDTSEKKIYNTAAVANTLLSKHRKNYEEPSTPNSSTKIVKELNKLSITEYDIKNDDFRK